MSDTLLTINPAPTFPMNSYMLLKYLESSNIEKTMLYCVSVNTIMDLREDYINNIKILKIDDNSYNFYEDYNTTVANRLLNYQNMPMTSEDVDGIIYAPKTMIVRTYLDYMFFNNVEDAAKYKLKKYIKAIKNDTVKKNYEMIKEEKPEYLL